MAKKHGNSKYDAKFCVQMLEYFGIEPYRQVIKTVSEKIEVSEGVFQTKIIEIPQVCSAGKPVLEASDFPTFAGFACKIGVNRDTLAEWAKNFAEFSGAYKKAKDFQENWLVVNSLRGLLPPASAIFTQKNILGWRDKQPDEVDVVINNHALSDEQLDNRIEALMKSKKGK